MRRLNTESEWNVLDFEVFKNKPKIAPYPPDVVKRRGLLMMAQVFLSNYQFEKRKSRKDFFGELYRITMKTYFAWGEEKCWIEML